jgi:putative oxidoreductase
MSIDLGLLFLRLVLGAFLFGHGAQKLFGWFGGPGLAGTTGWLVSQLRLRPAMLWAVLAGLSEVGGGLLLALGFLSPLGSAAVVAAMLMALTVHYPRFWVTEGGMEYALLNLAAAVALGLTGPGAYALDTLLGTTLPEPSTLIASLILAVLGVGVALATRAPAPRPAVVESAESTVAHA